MLEKQRKRNRRHKKIRAKIKGTDSRPRLCVFRSNQHIYVQLINDEKGYTILSSSDIELKKPKLKNRVSIYGNKGEEEKEVLFTHKKSKVKEEAVKTGKVALAFEVGKLIAKKALAKNIKGVIFDRGGYKYHGIIKEVAEGAREEGLKF